MTTYLHACASHIPGHLFNGVRDYVGGGAMHFKDWLLPCSRLRPHHHGTAAVGEEDGAYKVVDVVLELHVQGAELCTHHQYAVIGVLGSQALGNGC